VQLSIGNKGNSTMWPPELAAQEYENDHELYLWYFVPSLFSHFTSSGNRFAKSKRCFGVELYL